jgi:protein involved in polysaccharide export with SLBB domain
MAGVCLGLLAGCACKHGQLERALQQAASPAPLVGVEKYTLACPDVLECSIEGEPDVGGRFTIGPDGRIDLGKLGQLRVEGLTLAEVRRAVAARAKVAPEAVRVEVVEFNSQQVYIFGEINGLQRAVPYQGEETVLALLQRVGGVTAGAAPDSIYVVRTQVADGRQPEVFHIALKEIVNGQSQSTNICLQPFDQIYVGETRQSSVKKCMPPWLRPLYQALCGLHRPNPAPTAMPPPDVPLSRTPAPIHLPLPHRPKRESIPVPLPPPRRLEP